MQTYLVGGAVRDEILGLEVSERDYVVVGATEAEMKAQGYRQVGRDFPVFLHPDTGEEYALARTERKTAPGHQGFVCHADENVTLEEDLVRRDLTINAMAQDASGNLIDPHDGLGDLKARRIRHVSDAFAEDPLRILRVARFKARFHHLGFEVAEETQALLRRMVAGDLLAELPPERILGELDKALATPSPAAFFDCLDDIGAATRLWPEIDHAAVSRMTALAADAGADLRFVALTLELAESDVSALCSRLRCSRARSELALIASQHHRDWLELESLVAAEVVALIHQLDALRRRERFAEFSGACAALFPGSAHLLEKWNALLEVMADVSREDVGGEVSGQEIGVAIRAEQERRVEARLEG